jgi:branched-chain amino acid transport system permease protein
VPLPDELRRHRGLGSLTISTFNRNPLAVDRLSLPFAGTLSTKSLLVTLAIAFALLHLLVVAVRRSRAGDLLLALRESPAACATLGIDPAGTRLAVFAFSAALAAVGGGLYAGTLGSVSPSSFDLVQSLPLLLLTVAGGVATTGGAIFAGSVLGLIPVIGTVFASIAGILGVLPGAMGATLGRNPDGVSTDLVEKLRPLQARRGALIAVVAIDVALGLAWAQELIGGWEAFIAAFLVPFLAARVVGLGQRPERVADPLDGLETRRLGREDIKALDDALALAEVPR